MVRPLVDLPRKLGYFRVLGMGVCYRGGKAYSKVRYLTLVFVEKLSVKRLKTECSVI